MRAMSVLLCSGTAARVVVAFFQQRSFGSGCPGRLRYVLADERFRPFPLNPVKKDSFLFDLARSFEYYCKPCKPNVKASRKSFMMPACKQEDRQPGNARLSASDCTSCGKRPVCRNSRLPINWA